MRSKRENSLRVEQANKLHYQKVKQSILATKNDALVDIDFEGEKIKRFEADYAELMDPDKDDKLEVKYTGKTMLKNEPSRGNLARIKAGQKPLNQNASQSSFQEIFESDYKVMTSNPS